MDRAPSETMTDGFTSSIKRFRPQMAFDKDPAGCQPFRFFLDASNIRKDPWAEPEHTQGIIYRIMFGNKSRPPPPREELEDVAGGKDVWATLLNLLAGPRWAPGDAQRNECVKLRSNRANVWPMLKIPLPSLPKTLDTHPHTTTTTNERTNRNSAVPSTPTFISLNS